MSATTITVGFASVNGDWGRLVHNRLVAWWTGSQYIHCEPYFPAENETYTMDVNEPYVTRRIGRESRYTGWQYVQVPVTPRGYRAALALCRRLAAERRPFNMKGYYFFFLGVGLFERSPPHYTCARLTTEVLQAAGVLNERIDSAQAHAGIVHAELTMVVTPGGGGDAETSTDALPKLGLRNARYVREFARDAWRDAVVGRR